MAKSCISFLGTLLSSFSTNLDVCSRAYSTALPIPNELTPIQPPMGSFDFCDFYAWGMWSWIGWQSCGCQMSKPNLGCFNSIVLRMRWSPNVWDGALGKTHIIPKTMDENTNWPLLHLIWKMYIYTYIYFNKKTYHRVIDKLCIFK